MRETLQFGPLCFVSVACLSLSSAAWRGGLQGQDPRGTLASGSDHEHYLTSNGVQAGYRQDSPDIPMMLDLTLAQLAATRNSYEFPTERSCLNSTVILGSAVVVMALPSLDNRLASRLVNGHR